MKRLIALGTVLLLVSAARAQLLVEDFTYADGPLTNVAAGSWNWHSGSGGALTLNVASGRAFIDQNDVSTGRDDYNRLLSSSFDPATDNLSKIYMSFVVNFSALPFNTGTATAGSYFAHLKSSAANEFYARVGANLEGAAPGTFRMAIANESWPNGAGTVEFAQDLSLNQNYLVVVRLDLATDQSTLWIDPATEASISVTATDAIGYAAGGLINAFALRQGTSNSTGAPGDVFLDRVRVDTSFAAVIPEPSSLALLFLGLGSVALLRRKA